MLTPPIDVCCVGNALVDILAHTDDAFLTAHGLVKGTMALTDPGAAAALYAEMGPAVESSGGAAANTAVGVASFGGSPAFIGVVADDQMGEVFTHDIRAAGVRFGQAPLVGRGDTGRCLVLVTPDGQRTMNTSLGVAGLVSVADIAADVVGSSAVTYLEGYLFDQPEAKQAMRLAASIARDHDRLVAVSLSDRFCVDRHRDDFLTLLSGAHMLFANLDEAQALTGVEGTDAVMAALGQLVPYAIVTLGADGCRAAGGGDDVTIAAVPTEVVDTTGAGDLFAAGFLSAWTAGGAKLGDCLHRGAVAAAEVISHLGARPQTDLKTLI